jgi:hypothetical protein
MHVATALGLAFKQFEFENQGNPQSLAYLRTLLGRFRVKPEEVPALIDAYKTWSSVFAKATTSAATAEPLDTFLPTV